MNKKIIEVEILGVRTTKVKKHRRAIVKIADRLMEMFICDKSNDIIRGTAHATVEKYKGQDYITVYANG